MINILTIDLEDYYQVSAFESVVKREHWDQYESRIERNAYRLLEILEEGSRGHRAEGVTTIDDRNGLPQTSNLQPEISDPSSDTLHLPPCTSLGSSGVKATFFCLGWIAERYPHLIKEICNQGHEVACHGYDHRLVYNMTPEEFRQDIDTSKKILEDIIGKEIIGYRAPSYSITQKSLWALEILAEECYLYDSSFFPIHHDRYGIPNARRFPFVVDFYNGGSPKFVPLSDDTHSALCSMPYAQNASNLRPATSNGEPTFRLAPHGSNRLIEFPLSTVRLGRLNFPICGGGYFRVLPFSVVKRALLNINKKEKQLFLFYIHPWEIDPDQPKIQGAGIRSQFRHYVNLVKTEGKLKKLLQKFTFSSIREILVQNGVVT